jgi:zinc-ribbon domain
MAKIRCPACGKKVSNTAYSCPYCFAEFSSYSVASTPNTSSATGDLTSCSDCGHQISSRAPTCPNCGAPGPAHNKITYGKPDWGFEWRTEAEIAGWPLVHIAFGRKNGKLRIARGWIAIGQFGLGLITVAQFGVGLLFGFGQFIFGLTAVAQFALAICFGLGQFATGYIAIGQFVISYYGLAQLGLAKHLWSTGHRDPEAVRFFTELARSIGFVK